MPFLELFKPSDDFAELLCCLLASFLACLLDDFFAAKFFRKIRNLHFDFVTHVFQLSETVG